MRRTRTTALLFALVVIAGCSGNDRDQPTGPEASTPAEQTPSTDPATAVPDTTAAPDSTEDDQLIDVTTLERAENIYAAAAANAIAAAAQETGRVDWQTLRDSTAAIDTIEYPEIVEGLEVLEIDEVAVRVLTTTNSGEWGESYVCLTGTGVVASEKLCTE